MPNMVFYCWIITFSYNEEYIWLIFYIRVFFDEDTWLKRKFFKKNFLQFYKLFFRNFIGYSSYQQNNFIFIKTFDYQYWLKDLLMLNLVENCDFSSDYLLWLKVACNTKPKILGASTNFALKLILAHTWWPELFYRLIMNVLSYIFRYLWHHTVDHMTWNIYLKKEEKNTLVWTMIT